MNYYLIYEKIVVRGNPDNFLSFEVYKDGKWQHTTHWADKILIDSFTGFRIITEKEAMRMIA